MSARAPVLLITASAMAASVMQALDSTIANVALPHMQAGLSASRDQIGWVLTSYIVAAAIATPPVGYLARRFGGKQLFLFSVAGFTGASILCGIATSLPQMVAFRLLQGALGAALVPLSQVALLQAYPRERHGSAMAMWGTGVMIAPILGPMLGGWLTEHFGWHWVFLVNVPVGILAFLGLSVSLPKTPAEAEEKLDTAGFLLLAVAIGAFQLMLDRGHTVDWFESTEVVVEAGVALLFFYWFLVHSWTARRPFIPLSIFRDRNFTGGLVLMGSVSLALFSTFALLPQFLQELQGYPVVTAGVLMAPRGLGTMFAMVVAGQLVMRIDVRWVMLTGLIMVAAALHWMAHFGADVGQREVVWSGVLQGLGLGLVFAPLSAVTLGTLPDRARHEGAALFALVRHIGSSIGIALAFAYVDYGAGVARAALVENITPFNPALWRYLGDAKLLGLAALEPEIQRQAAIIGTLGVFHYMKWAVLVSGLALLLLRPVRQPRAGSESAAPRSADEVAALH